MGTVDYAADYAYDKAGVTLKHQLSSRIP